MASSSFIVPLMAASSACLPLSKLPAATASEAKPGRRRLSCKATGGGSSSTGGAGEDEMAWRRLDRRDVLLGLTGVGAAATTTNLGGLIALAAEPEPVCTTVPITAEVLKCSSTAGFTCPAEYDATAVVDFRSLPPPTGQPRVRRAAHLLDDEYINKFEEAFRRMKALDDSDPRSFKRQADIHEAYCDKHYKVVAAAAGPDVEFDVHYSSIFAPWHRMYIYFFERILGDLIGDPTFGLPYWNWDTPEGMILPAIFANPGSPLYNANRNPKHVRAFMDLNLGPGKNPDLPQCTDDLVCLIENNLYSLYRQMSVDTPQEFHGGKFCTAGVKYTGSLENGAHTAAHIWLGDPDKARRDMGDLSTAARDPAFYSNHSNVDRMWHIWATRLGHDDLPYQEWRDTSFVFYDEKKRPVRVRVADVLDTGKLGYTFQEADARLPWLAKRPKPSRDIQRPLVKRSGGSAASLFPVTLRKGEKVYVTVERPEKARAGGGSSKKAPEVLVVDLTINPCEYAKFDVLVNVPRGQEAQVGPQNSEFAGSFTHVPHGGGGGAMEMQAVSYRFPLRELIEDLKCGRERQLDVTLVPVDGNKVVVNGARVELVV